MGLYQENNIGIFLISHRVICRNPVDDLIFVTDRISFAENTR
jgi:hypothetical protein